MDLLKLERMVAIYEAGSFRKAAKDLGMSQPALTWSVRQLEETFNARLFERGPRGIRPTELCDRLVRRARLIFREQERMLGDVGESSRNQTITLGVHSIFLTSEFAQCVAAFSDKWPSATLRVREGFSSDLIERLGRGELDFACCALPDDVDEGGAFIAEPLASLNYSVVARADHPVFDDLSQGRAIGTYRWVEFDAAIVGRFPGGSDIEAVMDKVGRNQGRRSVRTASMALIRRLLLDGDYIGLIADEPVAEDLASGRLARLPGTQIVASRFGFLGLKEDFETQAVTDLKGILRETAFGPLQGLPGI
jgi:DNA-binding transcriptional LysR family regulator